VLAPPHHRPPASPRPPRGPPPPPPPRLVPLGRVARPPLLADLADVRGVAVVLGRLPPGRVVVPLVQAQVLRLLLRHVRPLDHHRLEGVRQQLAVVDVRPRDLHPQGPALALYEQAGLGAVLAAVRRVRAHRAPPKRALRIAPSAACQRHSTPPSPSHSAASAAQTWRKTPFWHQRENQRWAVESLPYSLGRRFHWQPERSRKMTALRTRRQSARGRPVCLGGASAERIGSMRAQSSSGTSQTVGSGSSFAIPGLLGAGHRSTPRDHEAASCVLG